LEIVAQSASLVAFEPISLRLRLSHPDNLAFSR
jgi:hypothetical protein